MSRVGIDTPGTVEFPAWGAMQNRVRRAFRARSRVEVDRLHREIEAIGAAIVAPPREYPEYTPAGYYALFFKDLEGIKYEIVCHSESG